MRGVAYDPVLRSEIDGAAPTRRVADDPECGFLVSLAKSCRAGGNATPPMIWPGCCRRAGGRTSRRPGSARRRSGRPCGCDSNGAAPFGSLASSTWAMAQSSGCSRRMRVNQLPRPARPKPRRYEKTRPGELIHLDLKYLPALRNARHDFEFAAVDDFSREAVGLDFGPTPPAWQRPRFWSTSPRRCRIRSKRS